MMGLGEAAQHLVSRYSGGMIRRLEIAQSLLHHPAVLFMDEPTVGLDPGAREAVWEHVLALREAYRMTMMVTTHYMVEVEELCDRLALISHGRIVAIGTPAEIKARAGPGEFPPAVSATSISWRPESLRKASSSSPSSTAFQRSGNAILGLYNAILSAPPHALHW